MASARPSSASSYGSQAHREKLQRLKDREDLKGLIVQKFIDKYKKPGKRSSIQRQVEELMGQGVLTEANLRALDQRLQQEMASDTQSFAGISVQSGVTRESEVKGPSKAPSVVSYMSGASDFPDSAVPDDAVSVKSQRSAVSSVRLPPNKDEWATILQYTTAMHHQHEMLRLQKEKEQKQTFKKELDRQVQENQAKLMQERLEEQAYAETQARNLALFDARERQRQAEVQQKRQQEKATREKQLKDQRQKKRQEVRKTRQEDENLLREIKAEDDAAFRAQMAKKQEEYKTAQEILAQNAAWKKTQQDAEEREKQAELRRQAELNALIDKQEADRKEEQRKREERQAQFLTQAADGALRIQRTKVASEDAALMKHYEARNQFDEDQEEQQRRKQWELKMEMRATLQSQMQEKRKRQELEKQHLSEQAEMWRKEHECRF